MLFETFQLGSLTLKNRVVMAPLTRSRATAEHVPTDLMATYYGQRTEAGLIITEGTSPSINGAGYPRIPGIYTTEQVQAWKKITQEVQEKGSKIFLQVMHTGRVTHALNLDEGGTVLAPSAVALKETKMYTDQEGEQAIPVAKEMTTEDIQAAIQEYVQAAKNAVEAGFDGVELHSANGYLMEQFIAWNTNKREDEYGGSVEKRCKFVLEVAQQVVDAIGKEKVGIRLSPYGVFNEIHIYPELEETYQYLSTELGKIGLTYIHIVDHSSMGTPEVPQNLKETIKANFGGAVILSGGYEKERAEKDLAAGLGDLVAFGRPFISNPDLVTRMQKGLELAQPDFNTFYTPGEKGYTDYPSV